MLPKKHKFPIQFFPKNSKTVFKSYIFTIKFSPNALNYNRVGVYITTKLSKSAVSRNRIKRVVLNFFNVNKLKTLNIKNKKNIDLLIIPNTNIMKLTPKEIIKEFKNAYDSL